MMSAAIIPFDFEAQAVRVIMRDDAPWFVAADVCRVLEHTNPTMAIRGLDEDEVTLSQVEGSHRPTNLISESGLYALVLRSDKPAARRFRKWVTAEVLPRLRQTGRYQMSGVEATREISTDRLLELLQSENELLRSKVPVRPVKRKRNVPLTDDERRNILRLIEEGLSNGRIARMTGRSTAAVSFLRSGLRVIDGGAA